ncbi:MAG: hypothetical protein AABY07_08990 [Nanoarchaeota archaeon]
MAIEIQTKTGVRLVRKTADQSVADTTLVSDTDLKISVLAGEIWAFSAHLRYDAGATPDIKFGWSFPAGTTMSWGKYSIDSIESIETDILLESGTTGSIRYITYKGVIIVGSSAGAVILRWAQNVLDAGDPTIVKVNSYIIAYKIN